MGLAVAPDQPDAGLNVLPSSVFAVDEQPLRPPGTGYCFATDGDDRVAHRRRNASLGGLASRGRCSESPSGGRRPLGHGRVNPILVGGLLAGPLGSGSGSPPAARAWARSAGSEPRPPAPRSGSSGASARVLSDAGRARAVAPAVGRCRFRPGLCRRGSRAGSSSLPGRRHYAARPGSPAAAGGRGRLGGAVGVAVAAESSGTWIFAPRGTAAVLGRAPCRRLGRRRRTRGRRCCSGSCAAGAAAVLSPPAGGGARRRRAGFVLVGVGLVRLGDERLRPSASSQLGLFRATVRRSLASRAGGLRVGFSASASAMSGSTGFFPPAFGAGS